MADRLVLFLSNHFSSCPRDSLRIAIKYVTDKLTCSTNFRSQLIVTLMRVSHSHTLVRARSFFSYKSLISSFESMSRQRMRCRGIADIWRPFVNQTLTVLMIGHETQVDRYI
jgi:hypothetical protein